QIYQVLAHEHFSTVKLTDLTRLSRVLVSRLSKAVVTDVLVDSQHFLLTLRMNDDVALGARGFVFGQVAVNGQNEIVIQGRTVRTKPGERGGHSFGDIAVNRFSDSVGGCLRVIAAQVVLRLDGGDIFHQERA